MNGVCYSPWGASLNRSILSLGLPANTTGCRKGDEEDSQGKVKEVEKEQKIIRRLI